jgi:3-oxoacyl-[acyl-carrier-protein] synthase-3
MVMKGKMHPHNLEKGHMMVLASVGAGMNINSVVYRFP